MRRSLKSRKIANFLGFKVITAIGVGTPGKIVSSVCYDKQQVCVYLQPLSR